MSRYKKPLFALAIIAFSLLLSGCKRPVSQQLDLPIVIATPQISQGSAAGFQRDLIQLFTQETQLDIKILPTPQHLMLTQLQRRQANIAAAPFRVTEYATNIRYAPSYQTTNEIISCQKNDNSQKADQKPTLHVQANSSQELLLRELHAQTPFFTWTSRRDVSQQDLLTEVANEFTDCTMVQEQQLNEAQVFNPNLKKTLTIGKSDLAWALPADSPKELIEAVDSFFNKIKKTGQLKQIIDRYYGIHDRLNNIDITTFTHRIQTLLPLYKPYFIEAAKISHEDWRLLAALAYQESHWDPLATSFSNVRGMMMLTESTAAALKVKNRLDPRESIIGGAKYFVQLKRRLAERIPEPDRSWLALAAYNQGLGHLEDARILTQRHGLNPDSWMHVKRKMPLLNHPRYYPTLKFGQARGGEAVILVENIRSYYGILKRLEPQYYPPEIFYTETSFSRPFK